MAVTVTLSVFCSIKHVFIPISSGFKKNTKNGLLSCHSFTLASSETGCSTHHRLSERSPGQEPFTRVLKRSVVTRRSSIPGFSVMLSKQLRNVSLQCFSLGLKLRLCFFVVSTATEYNQTSCDNILVELL